MDASNGAGHIRAKALDVQRGQSLAKSRASRFALKDYDSDQSEWLRAALDESVRDRPNAGRIASSSSLIQASRTH